MLEHRNLTTHTYDEAAAKKIIKKILEEYQTPIKELHAFFTQKTQPD